MTERTIGRLTPKQVINAMPRTYRRAVLLSDGGNLYLQCTLGPGGTVRRSWIFRYEAFGRVHDLGLGRPLPSACARRGTAHVVYGCKFSTALIRWSFGAQPGPLNASGWRLCSPQ